MSNLPLLSLWADMRDYLGLTMLRAIDFDSESGSLSALQIAPGGAETRLQMHIHPQDRDLLASMAGMERVRIELRSARRRDESFKLILRECRGGTSWAYGAMAHPRAPDFVMQRLASRSRLAELGQQFSTLSHELRQPLFTIALASENLRLALEAQADLPPHALPALKNIEEQIGRAQTIVQQTLDYASGRGGDRQAAAGGSADDTSTRGDLARAAQGAARFLFSYLDSADIELELREPAEALPVPLSSVELEQILVNVLRNAIESIEARQQAGWTGKGRIEIRLGTDGARISCVVSDNGAGLGGFVPETGFQPFATTKGEEGNGLGLYICEQMLAKAGGQLRLSPNEDEGAKVEITLPR